MDNLSNISLLEAFEKIIIAQKDWSQRNSTSSEEIEEIQAQLNELNEKIGQITTGLQNIINHQEEYINNSTGGN